MNPREPPVFEDVAAALQLQKGEAQQHHHARTKLDRVCRELAANLKSASITMASQPSGALRSIRKSRPEKKSGRPIDQVRAMTS